MTNPIAGDAERLSVQLLQKEKSLLGQASFDQGYRSLSEFARQMMELGMEVHDPELAAKYKAVRLQRYSRTVGTCIIVGLITWQTIFASIDARRSSSLKRLRTFARKELVAA